MTPTQVPDEVSGPIIAMIGLILSIVFKWIYLETAIQACIAAVVSVIVGYLTKLAISRVEKWIKS